MNKHSPLTILFTALLLGLGVAFVVDPLDPSTISTPFCLGMLLMALSLRQSVLVVATLGVFYTFLSAYALVDSPFFRSSVHPVFWAFQHLGIFLVVCCLTIYLARYRTDTQRNLARIQGILAKLPGPMVVSDAAGYIQYENEALRTIFKKEPSGLTGKRYVECFMSNIHEGKAMRYYIELFADQANDTHEAELTLFGGRVKTKARISCLGVGPDRIMITLLDLSPSPETE
jgi:hypothetical protein